MMDRFALLFLGAAALNSQPVPSGVPDFSGLWQGGGPIGNIAEGQAGRGEGTRKENIDSLRSLMPHPAVDAGALLART